MAFMQPDYQPGPFVEVINECGGSYLVPAGYEDPQPGETCKIVGDETSVFFRLSAPGYMDATDWEGPYRSLDAAKEALSTIHGCDPDTGDEYPDEDA